MAHTVANHNAGEVAAHGLDAPFPPDICRSTTNHIEAKSSALKRWVRQKCGLGIPIVRDCVLYFMGVSGEKLPRCPRVPPLLDIARMGNAETREQALGKAARAARVFLRVNAIDLTIDVELRVSKFIADAFWRFCFRSSRRAFFAHGCIFGYTR